MNVWAILLFILAGGLWSASFMWRWTALGYALATSGNIAFGVALWILS